MNRFTDSILNRKLLKSLMFIIPMVVVLLFSGVTTGFTQTMNLLKGPEIREGIPFFEFGIGNMPSLSPSTSRLVVIIRIPYDNLQFIAFDKGFTASCKIKIDITDGSGFVVKRKTGTEKVSVEIFSDTNSRDEWLKSYNILELPPGKYTAHMEVMDMDTMVPMRTSTPVRLKPFNGSKCSLSTLFFVKGNLPDDTPDLAGERLVLGTFDADHDGKLLTVICFSAGCAGGSDAYLSIRNQGEGIVSRFRMDKTLPEWGMDRISLLHAAIPIASLPAGDYTLTVAMNGESVSGSLALGIGPGEDLSLAIEQLIYIASKDELDKMRRAKGSEKQKLFDQFWVEKNGSTGNGTNSAKEEYYGRVAYADRHFRETREGWRTDRGMIYIKYGPPDEVDSHPFDIDSRGYEIWYYYRLGRVFYFYDLRGTGDYYLVRRYW